MKQFNALGRKYTYRRDDLQCQLGERGMEVPIVLDWMVPFKGTNILEVGNVLRKYDQSFDQVVIDAHEKGDCINIDVLEYEPKEKPDLIVSVSTIEHIGYDMGEVMNPDKTIQFFEWVNKTLPKGGEFIFTVPVGYNQFLDFILRTKEKFGDLVYQRKLFMRRTTADNQWEESEPDWNARYGEPFEYGNLVMLGAMIK